MSARLFGKLPVALALILAALHVPRSYSQGVNEPLAMEDDLAPGGGNFNVFSLLKINDLGQVAFSNGLSVFRAQRDAPVVAIVKGGQKFGFLNRFDDVAAFSDLNNLGQVVFRADLISAVVGIDPTEPVERTPGIFLGSGGAVKAVALKGAALPLNQAFSTGETGHTLATVGKLPFNEGPTLNDFGQVVFTGNVHASQSIINGSVPTSYDAVLRSNANGKFDIVAKQGSTTPAAPGETFDIYSKFIGRTDFDGPTAIVSNSGRVAYRARVHDSAGNPGGDGFFWAHVSSILTANERLSVGRTGQTIIPGAPGSMEISLPNSASRFAVDMNDGGDVAFVAQLNPSPGDGADRAVYRWSAAQAAQSGAHGLTEIARKGRLSPDGIGVIGQISSDHVQMNESGQAAFQSFIKSSTPNDSGVFRGDGADLTLIARLGQLTPDGQRKIGVGGSLLATELAINDAGQVVFLAPLNDLSNQFAGQGLFLSDGVETIEIIRKGRSLAGSTLDFFSWVPEDGVNALGQVAYNARLADGRDGVFLFTLEDIRLRKTGNLAWDDNANWTVSTRPGYLHHVSLNPTTTSLVAGPAADVTIRSLSVGTSGGAAQTALNLQAGVKFTATDQITLHNNSILNFEIGGTSSTNLARLVTSGAAALDGALAVSFVDGFSPLAGQSFDILDWGSATGAFAALQLPVLDPGLRWSDSQLAADGLLKVLLQGDLDEDGDVDSADLTTWNKNFGAGADDPTSDNGDGFDFLDWQRRYGSSTPPLRSGANSFAAVPEPGALLLAAASLIVLTSSAAGSKRRWRPLTAAAPARAE
jgi:hypothetical protein